MAPRRRIKTVRSARRDLISELPLDIKDRILECLPTRDAARTALLSTQWNDAWLKHGRLAFHWNFFGCFPKCQDDDECRVLMNIINNIVFFRAGPIKKFTLHIEVDDPKPLQDDIDRWCLFLSRNGIGELDLSFYEDEPLGLKLRTYKLPYSIFSCRTITVLKLDGLIIDLPVNAGCIFPSLTSLHFVHVEFENSGNRIASSISIPNLEKLTFHHCEGTNNFDISSPKLETLSSVSSVDQRWLTPHLKVIKTLWLCGHSLRDIDVSMFPTSINLEVLKLYELNFGCGDEVTVAMQLLQKFPNLRELDILAQEPNWWSEDTETTSRLLEDSDNCFISQDLKMLSTVKIDAFSGSKPDMLFVKILLSKSPALERIVVQDCIEIDPSKAVKILRDLSHFPRASLEAKIVHIDRKSGYQPFDYPWISY